jgi:hypothetical protein
MFADEDSFRNTFEELLGRQRWQGTLTEGEGLVLLTSSLLIKTGCFVKMENKVSV